VLDRKALEEIAASALKPLGYRLLELTMGTDRSLRLVIDAEPDVDLKDCVRGHRGVVEGLRAAGVDPEEYAIEVLSPGSNRLISSERDFDRFRGSGVVIRLNPDAAGRRTVYGVLLGRRDGMVLIREKDSRSELQFPVSDVKEIRLHA
jgi:ribosome maturation factor RimP